MRFIVGFIAAVPSLVPARPTTEVTLRVVDELGQPNAASQFVVEPGGHVVLQDETIPLEPGEYTVKVYPGVSGQLQGNMLWRDEPIVVGASAETLEFTWAQADMTVTFEDQVGAVVPASLLSFAVGDHLAGVPVRLPVTEDPTHPVVDGAFADGYPVRGFPGIGGVTQGNVLYRDYAPEELTPAGLSLEYTWLYATLVVRLVDQFGVENAGAVLTERKVLGDFTSGQPLYLPVTDDPTPPALGGPVADGYDLRAYPNFLGFAQGSVLYRDYSGIELPEMGLTLDLEHPTADFRVDVVDQDGLVIPQSLVVLDQLPIPSAEFFTGTTVTLPVTETPDAPPVQGGLGNGYPLRIFPSINGVYQGSVLWRADAAEELTGAGLQRDVVWEVAKGPLRLVDYRGNEAFRSAVRFGILGTIPTGTHVELPINDDVFYPTLGGPFAGGYDMSILMRTLGRVSTEPRQPLEFGPFRFEILSGASFVPAFVTIHQQPYGLRFHPQLAADLDRDGFDAPADLDDSDPATFPGAPDLPGDLVDQDGDGVLSCDPRAGWRSPGEFLAAVARTAEGLLAAGRISAEVRDTVLAAAAQTIDHRPWQVPRGPLGRGRWGVPSPR